MRFSGFPDGGCCKVLEGKWFDLGVQRDGGSVVSRGDEGEFEKRQASRGDEGGKAGSCQRRIDVLQKCAYAVQSACCCLSSPASRFHFLLE